MKNENDINRKIRVGVYSTVFSIIYAAVTNGIFWGVCYVVWLLVDMMRNLRPASWIIVGALFVATTCSAIVGIGRDWARNNA